MEEKNGVSRVISSQWFKAQVHNFQYIRMNSYLQLSTTKQKGASVSGFEF